MGLIDRMSLKKTIAIDILTVVACVTLLGCAINKPTNQGTEPAPMDMADPELIASWDGDYIPAFIEKGTNKWFVIYQNYGEHEYSFAAGESPDTSDVKYESSGEIGKLSVDGEYAAWAERIDIGVNINV